MKTEPLEPHHARARFRSGVPELDRYFRSQAGRDAARQLAAIFVIPLAEGRVAGYYTLSAASVFLPDLLGAGERKQSRYPMMPAATLSRLVVDKRHRNQGIGRHLLADALARAGRSDFESVAVIAEATTESAASFYRAQGFLPFPDRPDRLFRPMADIKSLMS